MTVGIVGLGLIGGSVAKAIQASTEHRVLGADTNGATMDAALADGAADGILSAETLHECDILLLAVYPHAAIEFVRQNARHIARGARVVDLCGVKRMLCEALEPLAHEMGFVFIGGHPMAGKERFGYGVSQADLFAGASMILTPPEGTPRDVVTELATFFLSLGFERVCLSDAREHDRRIAYTSQLAHILSSAYVKSPLAIAHEGFSAGSFQDMTRVATMNEDMWTELFLANRDDLAEEVDALRGRLAAYGDALRAGDEAQLRALIREGCEWKEKASRR